MKRIIWIILGLLVLLTTAQAASFDCTKAGTKIEKLICSNPELSALDEELGDEYQSEVNSYDSDKASHIVNVQKRWLKTTRNKCSDKACLIEAYTSRIKEFKYLSPFFGVYKGYSQACLNSILVLTDETIGMNDCRELPYDVLESGSDHVLIKPRSSSKCDIPIMKLSHDKPSEVMPIFGRYLVEMSGGGCIYESVDASMAEDQTVIFMNSKTGKGREDALHKINLQGHPDRNKYNELGLKDSFPEVRKTAAYMLWMDLTKLTPILLKVMTSDPDQKVRLSAALNLHCQFTCNGTKYTTEDIEVLESDLPLLGKAVRDEVAGRYVVEMLDFVWCDMTEKARVSITAVLESGLPYGKSTVGIDESAKKLLRHHSSEQCSS